MKFSKFPLIFVVEDNTVYSQMILSHLRAHHMLRTESFVNGADCLSNLYRKPDIIIQDYLLDDMSGIDILLAAKKRHPDVEFIFLSGQESIDIAINCMRFGAFDYIVKDQHALIKLTDRVNKIMVNRELKASNRRFRQGITVFFIALAVMILFFACLAILFPGKFQIF